MRSYNTMLLIAMLVILSHCAVGERSARIYKGPDAQLGDFPYTVFIRTITLYCTGTIISNEWVLTAAHCIDKEIAPELHSIFAGIVSYYSRPLPDSVQIRTGKIMITHPDFQLFNATNFTDIGSFNDLGLIKTNEKFIFNKYVNKAILSDKSAYGMHSCKAVGFGDSGEGKDHKMRYLDVLEIVPCKFVPDSELRTLYPNDLHICSYPENGVTEMRGGDSGGPLVCPGNLLVGVCFWAKRQNDTSVFLHVSVAGFIQWIISNALL